MNREWMKWVLKDCKTLPCTALFLSTSCCAMRHPPIGILSFVLLLLAVCDSESTYVIFQVAGWLLDYSLWWKWTVKWNISLTNKDTQKWRGKEQQQDICSDSWFCAATRAGKGIHFAISRRSVKRDQKFIFLVRNFHSILPSFLATYLGQRISRLSVCLPSYIALQQQLTPLNGLWCCAKKDIKLDGWWANGSGRLLVGAFYILLPLGELLLEYFWPASIVPCRRRHIVCSSFWRKLNLCVIKAFLFIGCLLAQCFWACPDIQSNRVIEVKVIWEHTGLDSF